MSRILTTSICVGLALVGCGSSAATSSSAGGGGTTSSSAGTSASATSTSSSSGSGDTLTVSGSLSATTHEISNSANKCTTNANGGVSAILTYDTYTLQFFLPNGTTTFPAPAGVNAGVAFYNSNDSSQEWAVGGSGDTATAAGTATLSSDGKSGSVDTDMLPHTPQPNPNLKPIHVKGTFSCS